MSDEQLALDEPLLEFQPTPGQKYGRQDPFLREALIATACFFPTGIISLLCSAEVSRRNMAGDFRGAHKAAQCAEQWALMTYRFSLVFYIILGLLFLGLIVAALLVGIDAAHVSRHL